MFTDMNIVFKSSLLNSAFNIWLRQVAALIPQCELDLPVGGSVKDVQPRMMTQALRKIHYALCHSQTLIIFLNQVVILLSSSHAFSLVSLFFPLWAVCCEEILNVHCILSFYQSRPD